MIDADSNYSFLMLNEKQAKLFKQGSKLIKRIHSSFRLRYLFALAIICCLSLAGFVLLSSVIYTQQDHASLINMSGRQRMLSQRITLLASQYVQAETETQGDYYHYHLKAAKDEMASAHAVLTQSSNLLMQKPSSQAIQAIYHKEPIKLNDQVISFLSHTEALLAVPRDLLTPNNQDLQYLLEVAPTTLLNSLDEVVSQYEKEATLAVTRLELLERGVLVLTLIILSLEGLLIFLPMERQLKRKQDALVYASLHDDLTGLANRALFNDRLTQALANQKREPQHIFALLFLDLDEFKSVNDSYGHHVGDALLIAFSKRLLTCVREMDTVARLGGDEFTIILNKLSSQQEANLVIQRIRVALEPCYYLFNYQLKVSSSIGLVMSNASSMNTDDLLKLADDAMYQAKEQGRNRLVVV